MNSDVIEKQAFEAEIAFIVTDTEEGNGGIVFAQTANEALQKGARRYGEGETEYYDARREPRADHYAGKSLPTWFLVSLGWRIECGGCGKIIDDDLLDERDLDLDDIQGTQETSSYCSQTCEARHMLERAQAEEIERRWLRRMKAAVRRRFAEATFDMGPNGPEPRATALYRGDRQKFASARVPFRLPFSQHGPLELVFNHDRTMGQRFFFTCPNGDLEAFRLYLALQDDKD